MFCIRRTAHTAITRIHTAQNISLAVALPPIQVFAPFQMVRLFALINSGDQFEWRVFFRLLQNEGLGSLLESIDTIVLRQISRIRFGVRKQEVQLTVVDPPTPLP